jgi:hypothetical protein
VVDPLIAAHAATQQIAHQQLLRQAHWRICTGITR